MFWDESDHIRTEDEGAVTLEVQHTESGNLPSALVVNFTMTGTATPGTDYTITGTTGVTVTTNYSAGTGTITLSAGTPRFTSVNITLTLVNDSVVDNGETIILTIPNTGGNTVRTLTITLFDPQLGDPTFSITGIPRVGETLTVTQDTPDPDGNGSVSSYQWAYRSNLRIIVGATSNSVTVRAEDVGRYYVATLLYTDAKGYTARISSSPIGPIVAATTPLVGFAAGTASTAEGAGTHPVAVSLSPAPQASLTINYTVGGTATGADYAALSGAVTVAANATSATIPIAITDDSTAEPDETIVLTLSSSANYLIPQPHYQVTQTSTYRLTIQNDDDGAPPPPPPPESTTTTSADPDPAPPTPPPEPFWISLDDAGVVEVRLDPARVVEGGLLRFVLRLKEPLDEPFSAEWATIPSGTATAGQDYYADRSTVQIPAGATTDTIVVRTRRDRIVEDDEEFRVRLLDIDKDVVAVGRILDDPPPPEPETPESEPEPEPEPVLPSLTLTDATSTEGDFLRFVVRVEPAPTAPFTVKYATASRTARAGADYEAASGTLDFDAGQSTAPFTVWIHRDEQDEPDETFGVKIIHPATGTLLAEATGTITDDDATPPEADSDDDGETALAFAEPVEDQAYTAGTAITARVLPEATGGQGAVTYRVFGLPAGLSFDAATRTISGTPEAATDGAVEVAYTAADSTGAATALVFSITVNPPLSFGDLFDSFGGGSQGGWRGRWPRLRLPAPSATTTNRKAHP